MKSMWTTAVLVALTCNQGMYDQIYRQIVLQALASQTSPRVTFEKRNAAIENLRSLCNGQLSSYERPPTEKEQASEHWN